MIRRTTDLGIIDAVMIRPGVFYGKTQYWEVFVLETN